jgi:hypothetical protein
MAWPPSPTDDWRVSSTRLLVGLLAGALLLASLAGRSGTATAGSAACGADVAGNGGYAYAGHQATYQGHGVRATITPTRTPEVVSGHVSGWVGVGGPGQGANGEDAWIQVGIATVQGAEPFLYAEITRGGRYPQLLVLDQPVKIGQARSIAVLEMGRRPGFWRVWVDGQPRTKPVKIRGSSGRWAPQAIAESYNGGKVACNRFAYRFERVSVSYGGGGSWKPFVSGHRFLDGSYKLRALATAPAEQGVYSRRLATPDKRPLPYAFVAASS